MPSKPRKTIEDGSLKDALCAICGTASLQVTHLPKLPDYVTCMSCNSVFVMEDGGERVVYGRIPQEYPETRRFALKQWAWLEAVERKAMPERPKPRPEVDLDIPTWALPGMTSKEARSVEPIPPLAASGAGPEAERGIADEAWPEVSTQPSSAEVPLLALGPFGPAAVPSPRQAPPSAPATPVSGPSQQVGAGSPEGTEPPTGQRHRVILKGSRFRLPRSVCVHCLRTPAPRVLTVLAKLPRTQDPTRRGPGELNLPLCASCQRRTEARSPHERRARMMALLISSFIAVLIVVVLLVSGVLDFQESFGMSLIALLSLSIFGFAASAWFLFGRAGRFPQPPDALYVRSTLHIPEDIGPPEVAFEWRNRAYADWFLSENRDFAIGETIQIPDRGPRAPAEG